MPPRTSMILIVWTDWTSDDSWESLEEAAKWIAEGDYGFIACTEVVPGHSIDRSNELRAAVKAAADDIEEAARDAYWDRRHIAAVNAFTGRM